MVITHNILLLIFSNTSLDGQKWIKTTPEKSLSEHIMKARSPQGDFLLIVTYLYI